MPAAHRIEPKFVERIWGASSLAPWFPSHDRAATARERDQPSAPSTERRIGEVWFDTGCLLVKFLFTSEPLSVQVHPDDECARARGVPNGKTEMWHVLEAQSGARLALGFQEPLTRERIREAALDGSIENLLDWHYPSPGDTFFTPAGVVHALGPGLVVLEIQQVCDTTYRLYDYNRGRPLHLDEAIAVLDPCARPGKVAPKKLEGGGIALTRCRHFAVESWTLTEPRTFPAKAALIVLAGGGFLNGEPAARSEVWNLEQASEFVPDPDATVVCAYVPVA
jgi:mannose-6-phosphate isomerase